MIVVISAVLLGTTGCDEEATGIDGSGEVVTRYYELSDFARVSVSHAFSVEITQSGTFTVSIEADDNLIDSVEVEKRGDTLHIGLESGIRIRGNATLQATVTMPSLEALRLSGASRVELTGFDKLAEVEIEMSGASRVSGELVAEDLALEVSGASSASLTGTADSADLSASGASTLDLDDLELQEAVVDLSGASRANVYVTGKISRIDVSGASTLNYGGDPEIGDLDVSGASTVSER